VDKLVSAEPGYVVTLDGHIVDYDADCWLVPTPIGLERIAVGNIQGAGRSLLAHTREFLALRLESRSPWTVSADLCLLRRLIATGSEISQCLLDQVDLPHIMAFDRDTRQTAPSRVPAVVNILKIWVASGVPGIASGLIARLPTLDDKYHVKSLASMRCPHRGALTSREFTDLVLQLHTAATGGRMAPETYTLCLVILSFTLRPAQAAALKARDVLPSSPDGKRRIRITSTKGKVSRPGSIYKERIVSEQLATIIDAQVVRARAIAIARGLDPEAAPLFWRVRVGDAARRADRPELYGWVGHCSAGALAARFNYAMDSLGLKSLRTGKHQHITATRARRTVATRLRGDGASLDDIRQLLGHVGTTALRHYVEPSREAMMRIGELLGPDLRAIAAVFLGNDI
jgi:hypothetical protein